MVKINGLFIEPPPGGLWGGPMGPPRPDDSQGVGLNLRSALIRGRSVLWFSHGRPVRLWTSNLWRTGGVTGFTGA